MLRSLLVIFTYITLFVCGLRVPAVIALAYIWTELFQPQHLAHGIVQSLRLSLVCGLASLIAFFFCRGKPYRVTLGVWLLALWTMWITLTTMGAEVPQAAWIKWDWAFKTAVFTIILPYFFNTREEIEAAFLAILIAIIANIMAVGLKTIMGGGGYNVDLSLLGGTYGISESSTLSMIAASTVPISIWVAKHSLLIPMPHLRKLGFSVIIALSIATSLGTFSRTGMVVVSVLGVVGFLKTRKKLLYIFAIVVVVGGLAGFMGEKWTDRMATMKDVKSEVSAMGRVGAWLWTIEYVREHPLGGGFEVYHINYGSLPLEDGTTLEFEGKAFHSIYFEVLGEQGVPGLILFLSMIFWSLFSLGHVRKLARGPIGLQWAADAASALRVATMVYMCGGAFIGVAYQAYFWFLFGIGISLRHYVDHISAVRVDRAGLID